MTFRELYPPPKSYANKPSLTQEQFTEVSAHIDRINNFDMAAMVVSEARLPPLVLLLVGFLSGALVTTFIGWLVSKRQQMKRQNQIMNQLVQPTHY